MTHFILSYVLISQPYQFSNHMCILYCSLLLYNFNCTITQSTVDIQVFLEKIQYSLYFLDSAN